MRKQEHKSLYDKDGYLWANEQVDLLKRHKFAELDLENIIEEIESVGRSQKISVRSYLINILLHELKIKYQPAKHTKSWDRSIINSKTKIESILIDNPSLKRELSEILKTSYPVSIRKAVRETGLDEKIFPKKCPWTIEEILD